MINVQAEELIYMIGELYVEVNKGKQINLRLAKQIDDLKNAEAKSAHDKEGEKSEHE